RADGGVHARRIAAGGQDCDAITRPEPIDHGPSGPDRITSAIEKKSAPGGLQQSDAVADQRPDDSPHGDVAAFGLSLEIPQILIGDADGDARALRVLRFSDHEFSHTPGLSQGRREPLNGAYNKTPIEYVNIAFLHIILSDKMGTGKRCAAQV